MIKSELNLSEVVDYFKRNQIPTFDEEIDQYGGYFINAAILASIILAPNPIIAIANFSSGIGAASLRASKLFSWLPDKFKYGKKGREKFAIDRYELSSVINFKLLDIAILNSLKDIILPIIEDLFKDIMLEEADKLELNKLAKEAENNQQKINIHILNTICKEDISNFASKVIDPILPFLIKILDKCSKKSKANEKVDFRNLQDLYINKIFILYNAFLINFSSEFPEFSLWCDISQKNNII